MSWIWRVSVTLFLLAVVITCVISLWINPGVVQELREYPHGERAKKVMVLTLPSGRTFPVNYLRDGGTVYAAADFPWWRELRGEGGRGTVLIQGDLFHASMRAVTSDPDLRKSVFARLRPSAPLFFGTLVVIDLDSGATVSTSGIEP